MTDRTPPPSPATSDAARARGTSRALAGFLAMAFAVVGFTGLLAAQVGRLPLERALQREAVLDEALAAARAGDAAALAALRVRLGDSATILPPTSDFEARVAAERLAQRARRMAEADATAGRLRALVIVVTLLAGTFGIGMLLAAARRVAPVSDLR